MQGQSKELATYIDHTILKPETTEAQLFKICSEAKKFSFFGVCVNSSCLPYVVSQLTGTSVAPVAVIGFPLGAMSTEAKSFEAAWCVKNGAKEIDMVLNVGKLKEKNDSFVRDDIRAVVEASSGALVKVILETSLLNDEEKTRACKLAVEAGAHFVKTCTGFGGGGATIEDILLMRAAVGPFIGVKASGGVKTAEHAWALIRAGATRLGTSSGVALTQGQNSQGGY